MGYKNDIENSVKILKKGGVLLYPTDTIWGLGCDATNSKAVEKIYSIKKRPESKSLIILVDSMDRLSDFVEDVPSFVNDLISHAARPLTIIYPNAKKLAKNVIAKDNSIAIRVVREQFCIDLIKAFGKPIVSTSPNFAGHSTPFAFNQIEDGIINSVDYCVEHGRETIRDLKSSTVIKLTPTGEFEVIRP